MSDRSLVTSQARSKFTPETVRVISSTVAKGLTEPEMHWFLELAARYELDPFAGHIWATKMGGQNGSGGRVAIFAGRDGFLSIANRNPDFEGLDSDVVHENDEFRVIRKGSEPEVHHSYTHKDRGDIVGAWAIGKRTNRPAIFFFAPIGEYKPSGARLDKSPWGKQETAMIIKCAESTVLRKLYQISGLVPDEEVSGNRHIEPPAEERPIDWGDDEVTAERLKALVAEAQRIDPGAYKPARIQLMLEGHDQEGREQVARELERFVIQRGGQVPDPGAAVEDAEVVS